VLFAIKTADLPLMTGAPPLLASHFWNILPAILLSIALAIFIFRQLRPATTIKDPPSVQSMPDTTEPRSQSEPSTVAEPLVHQPTGTADQLFVNDGTTPETLMALCREKTTHYAQLAVEPFIGKWIRVSGTVRDYYHYSDHGTVTLETAAVSLQTVHLSFSSGVERLVMLQGGERIVADGKIKEVDKYTFEAVDCEIVSIST
jgi:hypothetical protein